MKEKNEKKMMLWRIMMAVILILTCLCFAGCESSSGYRSSGYDRRSAYDAKYGAGSYDADKALMDAMRDAWPD